jgi:hypothetical protein
MDQILLPNISTQMRLIVLSAPFQRLIVEFPLALALLLFPVTLLYLAIYSLVCKRHFSHAVFTFFSVAGFMTCSWIAPVQCGPFRSLQLFASEELYHLR